MPYAIGLLGFQPAVQTNANNYKPKNMIRRAEKKDIQGLINLLYQVDAVHNGIRPDLFKGNTSKYTELELEEILDELQSVCKSRLSARNLSHRSSATCEGSPLLRTAEALGIQTFTSPTTSNWMVLSGDALKMGPGDSERSHRADEYLLRSELDGAVSTYIDFISTFYGNSLE